MSFEQNPPDALDTETISVHHAELLGKNSDREQVILATALLDAIAEDDEPRILDLLRAGADPRVTGVFHGSADYPTPAAQFQALRAFALISPLTFAIATYRRHLLRPMLAGSAGLPFVAHDRSITPNQVGLLHPSSNFYQAEADRLDWNRVVEHARHHVFVASALQLALEVNNQFVTEGSLRDHPHDPDTRWASLQSVLDAVALTDGVRKGELWRLCRRSLTSCAREIDLQFAPCETRWVLRMIEEHSLPPGDATTRAKEWAETFAVTARKSSIADMDTFDRVELTLGQFYEMMMVDTVLPLIDTRDISHVWKGGFIRRHFVDEDTPQSFLISAIWSMMRWAVDANQVDGTTQVLKHALAAGLQPDSAFSGHPLLHLAAGFNQPAWVDALLEAGAALDLTRMLPVPGSEEVEEVTAVDIARKYFAKDAEYALLSARSRQSIADAIARYRSGGAAEGV